MKNGTQLVLVWFSELTHTSRALQEVDPDFVRETQWVIITDSVVLSSLDSSTDLA